MSFVPNLEASANQLLSTLVSLPSIVMSNIPQIITFAAVDYVDDMVLGQLPLRFQGSGYLIEGVKKTIQAAVGQSVHVTSS